MLYDCYALVLDKDIAMVLGLNEAIVLEQVHYWIEKNRKNKRNFHEGRYWTYNTMDAWTEEFSFWSRATVKRVFKRLRNAKILITGNFNAFQMDKTLWYAIDYEELERRMKEAGYNKTPQVQNSNLNGSKGVEVEIQDELKMGDSLTQALPETSPEISTDILNPSISQYREEHIEKEGQEDRDIQSLNTFQEKFDNILRKCEIQFVEENYREATARAIGLLLLDVEKGKDIKISGNAIPAKMVERDIHNLDFLVIEHAISKFKEVSRMINIRNTIAYLKSCIYNAIAEMNIDIDARLRYAELIT